VDHDETDAELVHAVRDGNAQAFDLLVRRHLSHAYSVASARLRNRDDADDVCQDAFIKALQRIDECRDPSKFRSWLLTIVRNTAHNRREYNRVREAQPLEHAVFARSKDDPAKDAYLAEVRERTEEAMKELTDLQRQVLLLHDLEGWKHDEIAEELDISAGSSRVHLHVARKTMRKRLGGSLALGNSR